MQAQRDTGAADFRPVLEGRIIGPKSSTELIRDALVRLGIRYPDDVPTVASVRSATVRGGKAGLVSSLEQTLRGFDSHTRQGQVEEWLGNDTIERICREVAAENALKVGRR